MYIPLDRYVYTFCEVALLRRDERKRGVPNNRFIYLIKAPFFSVNASPIVDKCNPLTQCDVYSTQSKRKKSAPCSYGKGHFKLTLLSYVRGVLEKECYRVSSYYLVVSYPAYLCSGLFFWGRVLCHTHYHTSPWLGAKVYSTKTLAKSVPNEII